VEVRMTVVEGPRIGLSTGGLAFVAEQGTNPADQTFIVSHEGQSGTLNWSASSAQNWLTITPSSGSLSVGGSGVVTVAVKSDDLADGEYPGTITVTAAGAGNSPQTLGVDLTVTTVYGSSISGRVRVAEVGLGGVTVTLNGPGGTLTAVTDESGWYSFVGLRDGSYTVGISGYPANTAFAVTEKAVNLGLNDDQSVNFAGGLLYTLTVSKNGQGTVTSDPAGIAIGLSGTSDTGVFPSGTGVTLTAAPYSEWQVAAWGGACDGVSSTSSSCLITMDGDKTASVTFEEVPQGVRVFGTVYYSTTPLSEVVVELGRGTTWPFDWFAATTSDGNGEYEFPGIPPGSYWLKMNGLGGEFFDEYSYWSLEVAEADVQRDLYMPKVIDLLSPPDASSDVGTQPTLTWESNPEAETYSVFVYRTDPWSEVETRSINATSHTVSANLTPGRNYTWWVEGYDSGNRHVATSRNNFQFTVSEGPLPDLTIQDPEHWLMAEGPLLGTYIYLYMGSWFKNIGEGGDLTEGFQLEYSLRTTPTPGPGVHSWSGPPQIQTVDEGGWYRDERGHYCLPLSTPIGSYYTVVTVDAGYEVGESDESNNWAASTGTLSVTRDFEAKDAAVSPASPTTADLITISGWLSTYQGTPCFNGEITWRLRLDGATIDTGTADYFELRQGAAFFNRSVLVERQVGPLSAGQHTAVLEVDYNDVVQESLETNNTSSVTFDVTVPTLPNPPSNLNVSIESGTNDTQLNWQDNSDNELGFRIERCTGVGSCSDYSEIATVGADVTFWEENYPVLQCNYYRVRAYNAAGNSGYSNVDYICGDVTSLLRDKEEQR
jgi:hypothetical protein